MNQLCENIVEDVQTLLNAMETRMQSQFENLPTAGTHEGISAIKGALESLQAEFAKMAQEVARLDTMSSRIQSMNLSMHGSLKEVTRILHFLQETVEPSLDENKGMLQEMTSSWTELKASLNMMSTQTVEFRREFGEFRQAMLNSFEDKSKFDGAEAEKFRLWTQTQETHFA